MHTASQALAIERQASAQPSSAQPSLAERVSRPKTRAILGLVRLNFLSVGCPWPVLFLTGHGDVGTAVGLVKNGAHDYLEKPFQDNMLVDRIEQAMQFTRSQSASEREALRLRQALASLSPREREVLDELIRSHYNKNIADHLGITPRTVEFHRANIFEKMGVDSAIELAHKLGQLKPLPGQE